MQIDFARRYLRCPVCRRDRTLLLAADQTNEREVREGVLTCSACGSQQPVHRGVAHLLVDPPKHVATEAAGLERFAEYMRADGWTRDSVRQLPAVDDGYWYVQGASINQLVTSVGFRQGQSLLDVGSNTCWASNFFALRGLNVVALDIATAELQGLYTSDYFIEDGTSYFERVLGSMYDMPIASESLDYVYCCEVLHHNDNESLRRTFEECFRVLKPGGQVLVVNETLKTKRDPIGVHAEAVEQFEGYEHAHWAVQYRGEAVRAGFTTRLIEPSYHWFFRTPPPAEPPPLRDWHARARYELMARPLGRRAYLMWVNHIAGGVSFGMIATKPAGRRVRTAALVLRGPRRHAARSG
ncbi:MAG: methyltransferase domain-containing protein [Solirubrobacteraceae bacterium]